MEHTKGKWKVRYYHNYGEQKDGEPITPVIVSDEGRIATISLYDACIGRQEIANANAHRICQCVNNFDDLLDVCKKSPSPDIISGFADFAEECAFLKLSTFLRSHQNSAERILKAIAESEEV